MEGFEAAIRAKTGARGEAPMLLESLPEELPHPAVATVTSIAETKSCAITPGLCRISSLPSYAWGCDAGANLATAQILEDASCVVGAGARGGASVPVKAAGWVCDA